MRQAAADGAAVADRQMRHMRHRARQDRQVPGDDRRSLELIMARERADADRVTGLLDEREAGDAVDIDQNRRAQQAEIEHRNEALAAGDDLGVGAGPGQCRDGHVDALGEDIVEGGRLHPRTPRTAANSAGR